MFIMKIICISGLSGSGKTKASDLFAKILPNSIVVHGDDFMRAWKKQNQKEFKEIFEIPHGIENPDKFRHNNMTAEQLCNFIDASLPFVETEIEKIIRNKENSNFQFIIIEWTGLPGFEIWNNADYRVIVNSPLDLLVKNLRNRMEKKGYNGEARKVRISDIKNVLPSAERVDYIINNNYKESFLYERVHFICNKIMGKKGEFISAKTF